MDLNALAAKHGATTEEAIEAAVGRIVSNVQTAAEDKSRVRVATRFLLESLADSSEQLILTTYTSGGLDALIRRQPLMLGTGSAPAPELDALQEYADKLKALPDGQREGRGVLMDRVIDGTFAVNDDGTAKSEEDLKARTKELNDAKDVLRKASELKDVIDVFDKITDPAQRSALKRALLNVVEGRVVVWPNGSLQLPADTKTKGDLDAANKMLEDIKAHSHVERVGSDIVVEIKNIDKATHDRIKK